MVPVKALFGTPWSNRRFHLSAEEFAKVAQVRFRVGHQQRTLTAKTIKDTFDRFRAS